MVPVTFADADITGISQVSGATNPGIDQCAAFTTTVWACDVSNSVTLAAGDQVKIAAGSFTSGAAVAVKNATAFTAIVGTDTVKPTLSSTTFSTPVADTAAGSQAKIRLVGSGGAGTGMAAAGALNGTVGDVQIQALATGPMAGKAGNAVTFALTVPTNACSYTAATKTLNIAVSAATIKAPIITDLCNANATFAANFMATSIVASADYAMTNMVASSGAARYLLGGLNKSTIKLTFSEPLATFLIGDVAVSTDCATTCTNTGTEAVITTGGLEVNQEAAGVINVKLTHAGTLSAGLDKVTLSGTGTTDRNANVLLIIAVSNVVVMQSAG